MSKRNTCTFDGCEREQHAREVCKSHYSQLRRGGPLRPLTRLGLSAHDRFWEKVDKEPSNGCWNWTGAALPLGYGQIKIGGRSLRAHRVSWEMANGPIPDGMVIDHRCANPSCVNPGHLRAVTQAQNMQHRVGAQRGNISDVRGVAWVEARHAWLASATTNGKTYYGGLHPNIESADAAARALRAKLFTHDDHDEWLRGNTGDTERV